MQKILSSGLVLAFALLTARPATADQADCPAGSVEKNEDGFTWCEPSICLNDGQCNPGYVCVQMPLCMEVGNLTKPGAKTDAGSRLIARQICAEGTCPQKQTCSDLKRCLPRAAAERMGKLAAATSATPTSTEPAKKSSCGCRAVGESSSSSRAALAFLAVGVAAVVRRRRAR